MASGLSRTTVNARIDRIKRIFKWGVENEIVAPQLLQGLQAVAGTTPKVAPTPRNSLQFDPVFPTIW